MEHKHLERKVVKILEEHEDARGNDNKLYYYFFKEEYGTSDLKKISKMSINKFASVSRYRQKIQNEMPWLRADEITQKYRKKREEKFKEELRNNL